MKIKTFNPEPVHHIPCLVSPPSYLRNAGGPQFLTEPLPVFEATAEALPAGLDALIFTSDLQGFTEVNGTLTLIGLALPAELRLFLEIYHPDWDPGRVGVLLGGDLFALEHRRGGLGDTLPVWHTFRDNFRWVAGVSGNHDMIGTNNHGVAQLKFEPGIHHLDGGIAEIDRLRIGGVSGIIGPAEKINRREAPDFLSVLKEVLVKKPDVLVLHEAPDFPGRDFPGNSLVRETIEASPATTVVFGHCQWPEPMAVLGNGAQALSLDHRVVVVGR